MPQTLILNKNGKPLKEVDWKKGLSLVINNKADVVSTYNKEIKTKEGNFKLPKIIILLKEINFEWHHSKFCKKNVFKRDRCVCQYCCQRFEKQELTLDHVLPKSRGGETKWHNIVTCCKTCNFKKGDRTPEECEMELLNTPFAPRTLIFYEALHRI
jgi:CRISPR/Cas system Type II protein with McrA/HNH and RuvC-like nuclease domain